MPYRIVDADLNEVYEKFKSKIEKIMENLGLDSCRSIDRETYRKYYSNDRKFEDTDMKLAGGFKFLISKMIAEENNEQLIKGDRNNLVEITNPDGTNLYTINIGKIMGRKSVLKVVVIPDIHCPEHDETAMNAVLQLMRNYLPDMVIILGDFLENRSVSHWEDKQNSSPKRLVPELVKAKELLERISNCAGAKCSHKYMIFGNHEQWMSEYLNKQIPEVMDGIGELGIDLRLEKLLELEKTGWEVIPYNGILNLGNLSYTHGFTTAKHHAQKMLEIVGGNVVYGHTHTLQSHMSPSIRGLHEAASVGCLRKLNAGFLKGRPTSWCHAITMVEYYNRNGDYTRTTLPIIDGKMSYNGKIYDGNK